MPSYNTSQIRNVLIAGHSSSGKTSLVDALLFASGTIKHKASVVDKTSVSDFEKEEKEHGHSIFSSIVHADFAGHRINIIDTPGKSDLIGQAIACLPAVETVAVVISAQGGIEVVARRMMELAEQGAACFGRDHEELLRTRRGEWVAYCGDRCLGFAADSLAMLERCNAQGSPR